MSTIPAFEIGLLNLWICIVLLYALPMLSGIFFGLRFKRALTPPDLSAREKTLFSIWIGLQFLLYIYSVFVPFIYEPMWFYPGMIIYALGITMNIWGSYDYRTTPPEKLITKGLYQISRNVDYFSSFLTYIGMGFMGASWLILVLAILHFILYQIYTKAEERMCARLWPQDFSEYKGKVAKNFLFF
jgi:protein-S-isoprenylcysteine O-methyltransferase Ste14